MDNQLTGQLYGQDVYAVKNQLGRKLFVTSSHMLIRHFFYNCGIIFFQSAAPMPAPLPPKVNEVENKADLSSEIDSFYSDLATLEPEEIDEQSAAPVITEEPVSAPQDSPEPPPPTSSSPDPSLNRKRKKVTLY